MPSRYISPAEVDAFKLGVDTDELKLDSSDLVRAVNLALVSQASRYVDIVAHELDSTLYDQSDFLEALQRMLLGSPRARLRVLVQELDRAITHGHRLIDVARRMPTYIDIRVQGAEFRGYYPAFLVSDRIGYVYRDNATRYDGVACFNGRARADRLLHEFEQMWARAHSHPDLRGFFL